MNRRSFLAVSLTTRVFRSLSTCDAKKSTIFSLCSGPGKSAVAVFRVSGPSSLKVLNSMTKWSPTIACKQMNLKKIFHPSSKEQIDRGLVIWFPGPNSFTGEDVCELHVHGGPAIIKQIYKALSSFPDTRHALPGEFIKRSFENGKVDLTQIEGLSDLLNAENEMQRKQALKMTEGYSKNIYKEWSTRLMKGMAHIEALIDFGDEELFGEEILLEVKRNMATLLNDIRHHLKDGGMYERIRDGLKICIVGEPNVGKSSLLNNLCKRSVSIVTSHAGTTRDVIEVPLKMEGHQILLSDTAGLRTNVSDEVEKIGIERAYDQTKKSDAMILVIDSTSPEVERLCQERTIDFSVIESFVQEKLKKLDLCQDDSSIWQQQILLVFNKIDAAPKWVSAAIGGINQVTCKESKHQKVALSNKNGHSFAHDISKYQQNHQASAQTHGGPRSDASSLTFSWCTTSCLTESGLTDLGTCLKQLVDGFFMMDEPVESYPMNARHQHHLEKVQMYLAEFLHIISQPVPRAGFDTRLEMAAEQLRGALHQIGLVTGTITSDEILSQIFKDFCIGK